MNTSYPVATIIDELLQGSAISLPDAEHGVRCAVFADTLFEGLATELGLTPSHRRPAIAAALFHDVGYLRSQRDHHRKAFDILRESCLPGLDESERLIAACAARYHGGGHPNIEHAGFGEMSAEEQRVVRRIAAITRLAAALDASHLGFIEKVEVDVDARGARVIVHASQEPSVERVRLDEAAGSFLILTQKPMRVDIVVT
jgi:exopolyphosphatase / guanosine-5'-triphosphate,3'-diphosphate pyrophosphatase